ncbi:P-loop containing nucleoside triphosphate hydrolase protein [Hypoxylon sp. FL0890]|nr:P-loop containing nucleoside triphosphate hydrolase protein [Hypoxylon sp. FL0890]
MLPIISLIGIPAGGKGTLGSRLAEQFSLYHVSIGDMLRSITAPSPTVRQYVEGESLPSELLTALAGWMDIPVDVLVSNHHAESSLVTLGIALPALRRTVGEISKDREYRGILLNDFPRQLDHAKIAAKFFGFPFPTLAIVIDCPAHVARARYLKRARDNDNLAAFEKRLGHFWQHMPPLLKELEGSGLVRTVNDESMTIQQAYLTLLTNLLRNQAWHDIVNYQPTLILKSPTRTQPSLSDS